MRRVCIIETEAHYEVVRNFVLSIIDMAVFTIVTNSYCEGNLGAIKHSNVRILNYENDENMVSKVMVEDKFDYKLTTTPPSYKFYKEHSGWFTGSDLLVHNLNYWFQPWKNIYFINKPSISSAKSLLIFVKYLPSLIRRRKIYRSVFSRYLAPSEELFRNYSSNAKLGGYLSLDYNAYASKASASDSTTIVIPGTVNDFRDYEMVLKVVGEVAMELKKDVSVLLLGKNSDKRSFAVFENGNLKIKTFEESLSDEDYTKLLISADFGILPLREEIEHLGILERKGFSNISGGVNDLVYVGKMGFIPNFYAIGDKVNLDKYIDVADLKLKIELYLNKERSTEEKSHVANNQIVSSFNTLVLDKVSIENG